jgi:hypothetical protein
MISKTNQAVFVGQPDLLEEVLEVRPEFLRGLPGGGGDHRKWLLSALRAHSTAPHKPELQWATLRNDKGA